MSFRVRLGRAVVRSLFVAVVAFVVYFPVGGRANPGEIFFSEKISAGETDFAGTSEPADSADFAGTSASDDSSERAGTTASDDSAERADFAGSSWVRLVFDGPLATRLETSIVRFEGTFEGPDGSSRPVSVDLIGAIHVAEKDYYDALNAAFREYETVVFEMVAPNGTDVKALAAKARESKERGFDGSPLNALSFLQESLGRALGLAYQIDGIDYTAENLKRGDATTEEFLIEILANGDVQAFLTNALFDALLDRETAGDVEGALLAISLAENKRTTARRAFATRLSAEELESDGGKVDGGGSGGASNERENALIHFRNRKALAAVRAELESGKSKIGVFYGAAHLPDMRRRLETEFGLKRSGAPRWTPAWRMERGER